MDSFISSSITQNNPQENLYMTAKEIIPINYNGNIATCTIELPVYEYAFLDLYNLYGTNKQSGMDQYFYFPRIYLIIPGMQYVYLYGIVNTTGSTTITNNQLYISTTSSSIIFTIAITGSPRNYGLVVFCTL